MALVAFDGFDHYGTAGSDILNRRGGGLQWNEMLGVSYVSPGRNNAGTAVQLDSRLNPLDANNHLLGTLTNPLTSGYFGFGVKLGIDHLTGRNGPPSLAVRDLASGVSQLTLMFNPDSAGISVYRGAHDGFGGGGTLIATTTNNALTMDAWNFVEGFVTISGSVGAVRLRSNGQDVLNATGLNTQASGLAQFDGLLFMGAYVNGGNTLFQIDDFYIADTTTGPGLFPFDFFAGDTRTVTLHTIGNVGTPGWTPLALTNWQEVSEVHSDGDTSYNATATVGAKDLFNFEALDATISVVLAIQVTGCYRKDDAGTRTISQHLSSGGTEVAGATYSIPATYVYVTDIYTQDPDGAAPWSVAAVNALQAGYVLTA